LFVSPHAAVVEMSKEIADFAIAQRLPTVGSPREMAYAACCSRMARTSSTAR
jgi:hypothetical protein